MGNAKTGRMNTWQRGQMMGWDHVAVFINTRSHLGEERRRKHKHIYRPYIMISSHTTMNHNHMSAQNQVGNGMMYGPLTSGSGCIVVLHR